MFPWFFLKRMLLFGDILIFLCSVLLLSLHFLFWLYNLICTIARTKIWSQSPCTPLKLHTQTIAIVSCIYYYVVDLVWSPTIISAPSLCILLYLNIDNLTSMLVPRHIGKSWVPLSLNTACRRYWPTVGVYRCFFTTCVSLHQWLVCSV